MLSTATNTIVSLRNAHAGSSFRPKMFGDGQIIRNFEVLRGDDACCCDKILLCWRACDNSNVLK